MLERKIHGNCNILRQLSTANSGDFFVLELVVDSLKDNPQEIGELLSEVGRVWSLCVEQQERGHRYEKLRNDPHKMGNFNLAGNQHRPPPYPSQKV